MAIVALRTMMSIRVLPMAALVWTAMSTSALADTYPRQYGVDAVHYAFRLALSDDTDAIEGETTATLRFVEPGVSEVFLDLAAAAQGKGMSVTAVMETAGPVAYTHAADRSVSRLHSRPCLERNERSPCGITECPPAVCA